MRRGTRENNTLTLVDSQDMRIFLRVTTIVGNFKFRMRRPSVRKLGSTIGEDDRDFRP
jgi:hypothetical protein